MPCQCLDCISIVVDRGSTDASKCVSFEASPILFQISASIKRPHVDLLECLGSCMAEFGLFHNFVFFPASDLFDCCVCTWFVPFAWTERWFNCQQGVSACQSPSTYCYLIIDFILHLALSMFDLILTCSFCLFALAKFYSTGWVQVQLALPCFFFFWLVFLHGYVDILFLNSWWVQAHHALSWGSIFWLAFFGSLFGWKINRDW